MLAWTMVAGSLTARYPASLLASESRPCAASSIVHLLPGIPTIRPFEALACGIPLLCSPWNDTESLFTPGRDFLVARHGAEMQGLLKALLEDEAMAHELAGHGRQTILRQHTCAHRVDELLAIYAELEGARPQAGETRCAAD